MSLPILKKTTTTKTDYGSTTELVYILPFSIDTSQAVPTSPDNPNAPNISCDYKCYLDTANIENVNIKPFKLLKDDGTRVTNINQWGITLPISSSDYMEEIRKAFVSELGCPDGEIIIEII